MTLTPYVLIDQDVGLQSWFLMHTLQDVGLQSCFAMHTLSSNNQSISARGMFLLRIASTEMDIMSHLFTNS